jgi:hypothetical protein
VVAEHICVLHRCQVRVALPLEDDDRGVAESHEDEVQDEAPGASVAVDEGMHPLEFVVHPRQFFDERVTQIIPGVSLVADVAGIFDPGLHLS